MSFTRHVYTYHAPQRTTPPTTIALTASWATPPAATHRRASNDYLGGQLGDSPGSPNMPHHNLPAPPTLRTTEPHHQPRRRHTRTNDYTNNQHTWQSRPQLRDAQHPPHPTASWATPPAATHRYASNHHHKLEASWATPPAALVRPQYHPVIPSPKHHQHNPTQRGELLPPRHPPPRNPTRLSDCRPQWRFAHPDK